MTNTEKLAEALNDIFENAAIGVVKQSIDMWEETLDKMLGATKIILDKADNPMDAKMVLLTRNLKHFNKFELSGLTAVLLCKLVELEKEKSDDDKSQA